MSFEQYTPFYIENKVGTTLRPMGKGASFSFSLDPKEDVKYRLFTVGETEQYYLWKDEPDGPFLYRSLTDALDTRHAIRDRYALNLSCKKYEDYLKRVYKKIAWPPILAYLKMVHLPTAWSFGLTVSAEKLSFRKDGFLQMRIDIRYKKDGVDPRSVVGDPDESLVLPIPAGTYTGTVLRLPIEIPENTAHVGVFIEGKGYRGQCYVEQPFLSANGQNLLPSFNESVADRESFDWTAQYLSRKEWPEFRIRLNGTVIYTGEIFERVHRCSEWELPLPKHLLKAENTVTYELISDYHDPLPYTVYEAGIIAQPDAPLSILAVSEAAPADGKARVLIRTNRPNTTVTLSDVDPVLSGKPSYHFREAGLHGILLSCASPSENASFTLSAGDCSVRGTVKRIVHRTSDRVVTGTGDMIYVCQDPDDMEEYLSWYISNHVGDLVTIRPTYRWSGTRMLNRAVFVKFRRLMNELQMKYVLMADGREIPGISSQPDAELLRGKGFYGIQMHERDGAQYYWGIRRIKTHTNEMNADLEYFAFREDPLHTSSHHSETTFHFGDEITLLADRSMPRDFRLAHEKSVESIKKMRRATDTRHTGPSAMFKYMREAGYEWLGAETMYSTMEPLMGFLRGTAKEYRMKTYGVHHAVQWSSTPHESPARYRRYRLALYASYLLGATDINTEEGLWRLEEYYEHHHRFSNACRAHLKEQQDFFRYVSTHTRSGEFYTPAAFLHGRDDGATFFGENNTWGIREKRTPAEESWTLLKTVYPKANPCKAVYRHGCPEDVPQGYHSGTPYGNLDAIPAEAAPRFFRDYKLLLCLGYNRCEDADAEKLLSFVKNGGRLLLTRAHLTETSDIDAINSGALSFRENALTLTESGLPVFRDGAVGGLPASICANPKSPCEVLHTADDGTPLVLLYRFGRGEIVLFNVKDYPSAPAIRGLYESEMARLLRVTAEEEDVYAEMGDDVEFAIYKQKDGTKHLYFLATDWYRDPTPLRTATLRLGDCRYPVTLPFGVMLKCVTDGETAVWAENEDGEVLSVTGDTATVQGTGVIRFTIARNGTLRTAEIDFSDASVKDVTL